ncbi:HIRAN domain-containing protein [Oceanibaculum indicum]|uniref:HIRAN domain-containing protein n=1 Tax=Oceanibaculum indicum P24 TaxID=1207063 RepID=K2J0Z0_9PROT|nr:HIRAN domain-containing protein [Oceanibaculum indicum]EKE68718.1 hypothetical protein P24_17292 [Oceanibaculum indicum P24]
MPGLLARLRRAFFGRAPYHIGTLPTVPMDRYRALRYTAVHGESFRNPDGVSRQDILRIVKQGDSVAIVPEPDNPYDPDAVRIITEWGMVGYIPREDSAEVAADIAAGRIAQIGTIVAVHGGSPGQPGRGLVVQLYRKRKRPLKTS